MKVKEAKKITDSLTRLNYNVIVSYKLKEKDIC